MHSEHFPDSFFRVTIKGAYIRGGKLLLVKEPPALSGEWELPGGGLDFGETPQEGLMREVEEEMGISVINVSLKPIYQNIHRFENKRDMDWYYALMLVYQMELASLDFTATDECEAIDFFSRDDLQTLDIHPQSLFLREAFNPADFSEK